MQEHLAMLEKDYCPPLDAAIVHAIYSDYAGEKNALELTRELLEPLKASAVLEQQTDFDPSGSGGQAAFEPASLSSSSGRGDLSARSDDVTSLSTAMSSVGVGENNASPATSPAGSNDFTDYFQSLSGDAKQLYLMESFPTVKPFTVAHVLKKCRGDYWKATDELLNHAMFEELDGIEGEEKVERKGIDSFAIDDDAAPRGRKAKGKKKGNKYMNLDEYARSSSEPAAVAGNKWQSAKEDVGFISSRANVPAQTVASIYHKNGSSVSATIVELIELDMKASKDEKADDPVVLENSIHLTTEFPTIDLSHAFALIRMTHPSSVAAHELAKALTAIETRARPSGGIQIIPKYAPVDLSTPEESAPSPRASSAAPSPPSTTTPLGSTAAAFSAARSAAFEQASSAFRRGKSDKYMKAVAGYYGAQGRELDRALKHASAQEADALVAAQSSPTVLDLHGVGVQDATRIARARVSAWWEALGEATIASYARGRGGIGPAFRIVTGLGRHSERGIAKLGPAVGRMLMREGWKYEAGNGELLVMGKARRP